MHSMDSLAYHDVQTVWRCITSVCGKGLGARTSRPQQSSTLEN